MLFLVNLFMPAGLIISWLYHVSSEWHALPQLLVSKSSFANAQIAIIYFWTKIYFLITRKVNRHNGECWKRLNRPLHDEGAISQNIARYRKTVSSALWIQMTLLACYLPYGIATATVVFTGLDTSDIGLVWAVTVSLLLLNSLLNPFLYCWKIREVRQAVKDVIRQLGCLSS